MFQAITIFSFVFSASASNQTMLRNKLLLTLIFSLVVNGDNQRNLLAKTKKPRIVDDAIFEAILANYSRQANTTSAKYSRHPKSKKFKNIQDLYQSDSRQKVATENEDFNALLKSFGQCDDECETLEAKQKQIEAEHNTTQQDLQSQFDQISQQIQSYQSKLNDIHKIQDQSSAQIKLFQKTISQIDQLIKKRGSMHVHTAQFIELFNHANRALAVIDKNLQIFCTNQGKGSHATLQTHLNDTRDGHMYTYKTTVCSNTRVGHMKDTFNRIVHILRKSQQEKTELSRDDETQKQQISVEMEYIIKHKNDVVNETKIKLSALEQEILLLKTNMSQLTTQKQNILIRWESMVDGNDFVTRRFSRGPLQTYYIIQFYINSVLPLLIEQRVRWYVSCYSHEEALLYDPFVELNSTWMKWQLFHKSAWYFADKYSASIDSGLKANDLSSHNLQVIYQRTNAKLSEYMKQIQNIAAHGGLIENSVEMLLKQIQQQLNLKLRSLTLPITEENEHLVPLIHDDWKHNGCVQIECARLSSCNTSQIVFQNFTLLGDIGDTRRHMFSFAKKQYDVALYYQKKIYELKKQEGLDLNMRMNINLLQWSILHNKAYLLFLKVKTLRIDPTDEMMKSALGLVTYRVEHLKEKEIDSIEFYQQIINKTYINYWQKSIVAVWYLEFLNHTRPFLATF